MSKEFMWDFGIIVALLLAPLFWAGATAANAQALCAPRRELIDNFKARFGEVEQWIGRVDDETTAVLLTSKSGRWSLILVKPDFACLLGAGDKSTVRFGDPV